MKLNKSKCWIFYLWCSNPGCMFKLEDKSLESSPMERQEGVWIDGKLNMRHQCPASQEGNCVLGSLRHSIASCGQEKWSSIFTMCLTSGSVCCFGSSVQGGHQTTRACPEEGDQGGERSSEKDLQRAADITFWECHYPNSKTGKKRPYITLSLRRNSLYWLWNVSVFLLWNLEILFTIFIIAPELGGERFTWRHLLHGVLN